MSEERLSRVENKHDKLSEAVVEMARMEERLMPEAIGKGIASYISSLKTAVQEPANRQPVEPISRREPGPSKSVEISISQEALDRRKNE